MDASDHQLLEAALRGDADAFEMVIRTYSRTLYAVAFAILRDRGESEDVVQETFIKAFHSRWRVRNAEKFPAWLASVARNRALDMLRKRRWVPLDGHEPVVECAGTEDEEMRDRLRESLAALPETHRIALTLRYLEGLGHEHIEQTLGVTNGALRGILGRALGTMRKALKPCLATRE